MRCPAALAAIALVAGAAMGALAVPPPDPIALLVVLTWTTALLAFLRGRDRRFVAAVTLGFAAVGALEGRTSAARALNPTIRQLFDRELARKLAVDGEPVLLEALLIRDAAPVDHGVVLDVEARRVQIDGVPRDVEGGVRLIVSGILGPARRNEWRAGRLVRAPVFLGRASRYLNFGARDQEVALARRGLALVGTIKSASLVDTVARGSWVNETTARARAAVRAAVQQAVGAWSEGSAAVATAILIGDRAGLDVDVTRRLQQAGTYHVIAISGGNIAILAVLLIFLFRLAGAGPRLQSALALVSLIAYAFVVGSGASVLRATTAAVAVLAARLLDHRTPPLNALALAAVVAVAALPLSVLDVGFALTFGATLAILIGTARVTSGLRRLAQWAPVTSSVTSRLDPALVLLAATICAELALFPISALVFSRVTCAGLMLNFAAIPLMTIVQIAGFATVIATPIDLDVARYVGLVAHLAASWLVGSASLVQMMPWLALRVPPPAWTALAIYYGAWLALFSSPRPTVQRIQLGIIVASGMWMLIAPAMTWGRLSLASGSTPAVSLSVTVLDVGQGDATLVQLGSRTSMLVDAGGAPGSFDIGERVVSPALWALGVRRLEYFALTHGDPDHIGGGPAVVRDFRPREIWEGVPVPPHRPLETLKTAAASLGSTLRSVRAGDEIIVGAVTVHLWHPPPPDWERQKVRNDDSLVMEATLGDVSVLLTGDIGRDVERILAPELAPVPLRIVKAPHHGSGGSSTQAFIDAARPAVVIFSAGRGNRFGHPAGYVMERYRRAGARIFRTDEDGAVRLQTNGRTVWITTTAGRTVTLTAHQTSRGGD
ncbi:MAG: DNA internalization-related competence protein ComEC/Rec2 [Acidobacteria bacterium]|nr:DNA internalization-related competence protein ComEC/Rec2 [Acidobacteriota bacterium]